MEYRKQHLAKRGFVMRGLAVAIEKAYVIVDRILWRRYRRVICISETVRDRVAQGGLWPRDKMVVMYPGVDGAGIAASDRFEPFFFLPGRLMWTKNIELGIAAFQAFRHATGRDYRLIVAGMVDVKSQAYYALLRSLAAGDAAIVFHDSPTDQEMDEYYDRCAAVLFTAFNEDLGLTPMEAMAHGKPVIAVNRGGPTEVVEHGVTGFLEEANAKTFAAAMTILTSDERILRTMGQAGLERVKRFTWEKFVSDLDGLLEACVNGNTP
jgi:glycosyltransferase involved in cell wall biosynthesis